MMTKANQQPETVKELSRRLAMEFFDAPPKAGELASWLEERLIAWRGTRTTRITPYQAETARRALEAGEKT